MAVHSMTLQNHPVVLAIQEILPVKYVLMVNIVDGMKIQEQIKAFEEYEVKMEAKAKKSKEEAEEK